MTKIHHAYLINLPSMILSPQPHPNRHGSSLPFSSMLLLLSLAFGLVEAQIGQIQVPECLPAAKAWNWTFNSFEQSPCTTAGYLASQCNNGAFTIPQLAPGNFYTGPSGNDLCQCNTVVYSLLSACAGCQNATWLSWDDWSANCSSSAAVSTFPQSITDATRVPAWAFLNLTTASVPWDNVTACNFGDTPESVGSFRPSFAPNFSPGSSLSAGVIAGVIAGSTVTGLAAIAVGVWYLVHRRRRRGTPIVNDKPNPPAFGGATQLPAGYESVAWTSQPDMRLYVYDPADPRTYPNLAVPPGGTLGRAAMASVTSFTTTNESKTTTGAMSNRTNYSGLPEV